MLHFFWHSFAIVYAVFASPKEKRIPFNYVISFILFGVLGFGVVTTANIYISSDTVSEKQVTVQGVTTGARIASAVVIDKEDSYLGQGKIYIHESDEQKYKEGQQIIIKEVKGKFGLRWVEIKE